MWTASLCLTSKSCSSPGKFFPHSSLQRLPQSAGHQKWSCASLELAPPLWTSDQPGKTKQEGCGVEKNSTLVAK